MKEFYRAILSDFISSCRKYHSCETALLRMAEDWRSLRDRWELVGVVSMDLSKAFDLIQHDLLLAKLKAYGVGEKGCELLKDYLTGRQQRVRIGEIKVTAVHESSLITRNETGIFSSPAIESRNGVQVRGQTSENLTFQRKTILTPTAKKQPISD